MLHASHKSTMKYFVYVGYTSQNSIRLFLTGPWLLQSPWPSSHPLRHSWRMTTTHCHFACHRATRMIQSNLLKVLRPPLGRLGRRIQSHSECAPPSPPMLCPITTWVSQIARSQHGHMYTAVPNFGVLVPVLPPACLAGSYRAKLLSIPARCVATINPLHSYHRPVAITMTHMLQKSVRTTQWATATQ